MLNQTNSTELEPKETLLHTHGLCFSYSKKGFSVNNIQLNIRKGEIYGFLGRNGSGKTTVIQLLLGLLRPNKGGVFFKNKNIEGNKLDYLAHIGNIIEYPSLYEHLTVEDNLLYHTTIRNRPTTAITEVLELVNLAEKRNEKTSTLSLGMKQRLGIAIALCHEPDLLLLDEPTNGLDPLGIIDLRQLLLKLRNHGKTILFSSHLLSEVSQLCDTIGIIENGNMVGEYSMSALNATYSSLYIVETDALEGFIQICVANDWAFTVLEKEQKIEINLQQAYKINALLAEIALKKLNIRGIEKKQIRLEDFYLSALT
jgi:ABC-type multidrug transport system ATPase subunit